MTPPSKARAVRDFDKLDPDIRQAVRKAYPKGFIGHTQMVPGSSGKMVSAVPFETEEKHYLVRLVNLDVDDPERSIASAAKSVERSKDKLASEKVVDLGFDDDEDDDEGDDGLGDELGDVDAGPDALDEDDSDDFDEDDDPLKD